VESDAGGGSLWPAAAGVVGGVEPPVELEPPPPFVEGCELFVPPVEDLCVRLTAGSVVTSPTVW
jgi:hypothetical protein